MTMMERIDELLYILGAGTAHSLWLPLLAWTVYALPVYAWLRWREYGHPLIHYYLQRALLLSLPLGLLTVNLVDVSGWAFPSSEGATSVVADGVYVLFPRVEEVLTVHSPYRGFYYGLGLITLLALLLAVWQLLRLGGQTVGIIRFFRHRGSAENPRLQRKVRRLARELEIQRPIQIIVASDDISPMTFGYRRPVVVIPRSIVDDEQRVQMTLIHELTHIRRGDYLWHWLERLMEACMAVHPLVRWLRQEIAALREMICDAEVLETLSCSRKQYALLLYETVTPAGDGTSNAVAMSERGNNLKRRINAMKKYPEYTDYLVPPHRLGLMLGGLLLLAGIVLISCTDIGGPNEPATSTESADDGVSAQEAPARPDAAEKDPEVFVAVAEMPQLQGGLSSLIEEIQYPEQAYEAGVEGQVIVQFTVDRQGAVVNPRVLRGIGAGCDEEALRVVKLARFTPGRDEDGKRVRVKMSVPIRFALDEPDSFGTETEGSGSSAAINLEIGADNDLRLNDRPVTLEQLTERLNSLAGGPVSTVNVRVEGNTPMKYVTAVQERVRASGHTRITYQTRN
jgi:TonB family protein